MAGRTGQRWRQAAVWLHVVTSVGWMGQALAMASLLTASLLSEVPSVRAAAVSMTEHVDTHVLVYLANAGAFTGFMLAATTSWGFFRHWWVLGKFVITVAQLYVGIFLLSSSLHEVTVTAQSHVDYPSWRMVAGTAAMASAIAFQAWLSVAKPWSRTPWTAGTPAGRAAKLPTAPNAWFAVTVLAPIADVGLAVLTGQPLPATSLIALTACLAWRSTNLRAQGRAVTRPAS